MFRDISFGQYYPVNSPIHKLDARVKLLLTILYVISIFFVNSYFGFMVQAVMLISIILIARLPFISIIKSIRVIIFMILFTSLINLFFIKDGVVLWEWEIFTITKRGVHTTIKMILRLVLLISGSSILSLTTTPVALSDGIESLLSPLKKIKVPVRDIAMTMSITLKFIPILFDETNKIISAQKARGASFDTGGLFQRAKSLLPVLIPLFVNSFRRADELSFAMDARCYNATENRTKMKIAKLHFKDLFAVLVVVGVFIIILLDRYYWLGEVDKLIFGGLL